MDVIGLTEKELQTITAAMAGNFPESLSQYRMGALRKLAKAQHTDTGVVGLLREALPRVIQTDGEYGYEDDLVDRISAVVGEPPEMSAEEFLGPEW